MGPAAERFGSADKGALEAIGAVARHLARSAFWVLRKKES